MSHFKISMQRSWKLLTSGRQFLDLSFPNFLRLDCCFQMFLTIDEFKPENFQNLIFHTFEVMGFCERDFSFTDFTVLEDISYCNGT
jgi:hypothetical protein